MRVPVDWLREYVAVPEDATGEAIAASLVAVGLEEEGLHTGGVTGPLVVGRVLTREPEPQKNGRTINWCTVDVGDANGTGEPQGIVCGAHNFEPGDLVVVILPGGVLTTPQGPLEVSARRTYGHVSAGMICSERELGIGDDHDGILVLTRRFAGDDELLASLVPGTDALPLLGLDRETVEVNVTPDRGYCFSVRGVAREYSHATGAAFTDPALALAATAPEPTDGGFEVVLADESPIRERPGCDRYVARVVRGLDVSAPTPRWMATRLTEAGMRPISLPVDVTNYVMLGLGQPLHAFDLATLEAPIVVRRARSGERITTLDDADRALDTGDLLITDRGGERPVAIAGVMGGAETEVGSATRDVLIEAAHFEPVSVARSARRHKLPSEASRRFERGVDPALAAAAAQLAVELLVEHGGGVADPDVTDVGSPAAPEPVTMPLSFPSRVVGVHYGPNEVTSILEAIGAGVTREGDTVVVTPPTWRPDLTTAEDLVEEVARIHGYERIPSIVPSPPGGAGLTHAQRVRRTVATTLAGQGLSEIWSAPFVGADRYEALGLDPDAEVARSVRLANPLSDEAPLMRTRLLATMVDALRRNVARGTRDVGIFELGLVVDLEGEQRSAPTEDVGVLPSPEVLAAIRAAVPRQPRHVAFLLAGDRDRAGWWGEGRAADVSDVLEVVRVLGEALAVEVVTVASGEAPFHPGRCAAVSLADGTLVGHVGELHPKVVAALGLPARTVGGELDLDVLTAAAEATVQARTLVAFPMAQSDVALVVDEAVPAARVEAALRSGAGETLESVALFDVYRGDQVGEGRKSLAYRLTFRAPDRTLTTDEVSTLRDAAARAAGDAVGAVQRT
ncbi:phenylalanine--tRNA ligase subunit beta [Oryzobacter terrae]|uniref:phenylalanine--tRNA ligase subunit beta n=1 Tax=Oryzobacter terrae TaxID=1620385 RepID=UPI00366CD3A6